MGAENRRGQFKCSSDAKDQALWKAPVQGSRPAALLSALLSCPTRVPFLSPLSALFYCKAIRPVAPAFAPLPCWLNNLISMEPQGEGSSLDLHLQKPEKTWSVWLVHGHLSVHVSVTGNWNEEALAS